MLPVLSVLLLAAAVLLLRRSRGAMCLSAFLGLSSVSAAVICMLMDGRGLHDALIVLLLPLALRSVVKEDMEKGSGEDEL